MPLHTIMTAAKIVSRASPDLSAAAPTMTETIRATSMIVTATARTSVPNGSDPVCDHFGVIHGCEYGGDQSRSCGQNSDSAGTNDYQYR